MEFMINFTNEELIFAALHHDLGKIGDLEGNDYYVPQERLAEKRIKVRYSHTIQNYNI